MKAPKQVPFVKDASKAADLWAAENGSKLLEGSTAAEYTRRAAPAGATNVYVDLDRDGEEVTEPEQVEVFRQHYETLGQPLTSRDV
jgi:hypothetical protein